MLAPVVVMGQFEAFAPQVIEARGYVTQGQFNVLGGQWVGMEHQSTAPGGTIIEDVSCSNFATFNMAPVKPFTGAPFIPFTMGGQPLFSLFELTGINIGVGPTGAGLGGSQTGAMLFADQRNVLGSIWVPPSWWFWCILQGPSPNASAAWRFREIPEAQGPA